MEYVTDNFNSISIVSCYFYDKLVLSQNYQMKCKEKLYELTSLVEISYFDDYQEDINTCITLITDKNYMNKLLLLKFFTQNT